MSKSFKDLVAFQRALDVVVAVYDLTAKFPKEELYGLTSQMRRASIGVISDIAEGQGRLLYGEWRQFLSQARGSLFEVEAQCIAAERLHVINARELAETTRLVRSAAPSAASLTGFAARNEAPRNPATQQPSNRRLPQRLEHDS